MTMQALALPLESDEFGSIRIAGSRVTLDLVIEAFNAGASASEIADEFDSISLADVHIVLGYYLKNRAEVDTYMARRESEAHEWKERFDRDFPPRVSPEEQLARWSARKES